MRIEFRTGSMRSLKKMDDVVMKCAKAAAMALDCTVSWKPALADFADMVRVLSLEEEVARILGGLGEKVTAVTPPIGSTDMGNVSYRCPSIQPLLSITKEKLGLHTQAFSNVTTTPEAHEAIARGAEALVLLSLKVFNDSDFRKEVHEEFLMQRDLKNSL